MIVAPRPDDFLDNDWPTISRREQTRLISKLFVNFLWEFRVALTAHNGLIVGSRPSAFGSVKAVVPRHARHCPERTALFGAGFHDHGKIFHFWLIPANVSFHAGN